MSDARPVECRFRLKDEGKAYPRSACVACGKTITTGLGTSCSAIPQPGTGATVREATAPLEARIDALRGLLAAATDDFRQQESEWQAELLGALEQIARLEGERNERDATIADLRDHLSEAQDTISRLSRCMTAGDLQRAREAVRYTENDPPQWPSADSGVDGA